MISKLVVIGVGLIGGSLACALRKAGKVETVVGVGRGIANLEQAVELGVIDSYSQDAAQAVVDADMVVIGATLGSTADILARIAPALGPGTVVTDVGSTKASVVASARAALGEKFARFVPGHPIAGTEHSGAQAAFAELYVGHRVILTPVAETDTDALICVRAMWETAGARVAQMSVADHDRVLAATSHLPHMLAFTLVDMLAAASDADDIFAFAAGGFRDFTRIASSNPEMWRDIALANRDALLEICGAYNARLERLMQALRDGDGATLELSFKRAKEARDRCVVPQANVRRQ
ncbi:MAG: prephenate dehydrogenase/arogenate dehydrogenase family protein [Gammaproteobacteria bacterium]|nr:prephenate dehydrogenase/arogenate dehydrogenase family protein [Gammaproteobacteria bacterium]